MSQKQNENENEDENKTQKISYEDAAKYWASVPATVDGVLGGFGSISTVDVEGSNKFLKRLFQMEKGPGHSKCVDCGAGIGRITKNLLQNHFHKVDLVEQDEHFLEKAKTYLHGGQNPKIGTFYHQGLQDFVPETGRYNVIWCQWVMGHLTDDDFISFLRRCENGLKPFNSLLCVKENMTSTGEVDVDKEDSSVTRPESELKRLFEESGYDIVLELFQEKFPEDIYKVKMFALRPKSWAD